MSYETFRSPFSLVAWPNPANDIILLQLRLPHGEVLPANITLTSVSGGHVVAIQRNGNAYTLDAARLPSGVYVATATLGTEVVVTRLVVAH